MSEILSAVVSPWTEGYWARVIPVPSPKLSDAYGEGDERRVPSIPVLVEFFPDEATAVAVAKAERGSEDEKETGATTVTGKDGMPPVPGIWAEADPSVWMDQVRVIKKKLIEVTGSRNPENMPPPAVLPKIKSIVEGLNLGYDLGATNAEVFAWLKHV